MVLTKPRVADAKAAARSTEEVRPIRPRSLQRGWFVRLHARAPPNQAMVADGAEEVDGGNHGIATPDLPPLPSWPTWPPTTSRRPRVLPGNRSDRQLAGVAAWSSPRLPQACRYLRLGAPRHLVCAPLAGERAGSLGDARPAGRHRDNVPVAVLVPPAPSPGVGHALRAPDHALGLGDVVGDAPGERQSAMIVTGTADGLGPRECPQYSGGRYREV